MVYRPASVPDSLGRDPVLQQSLVVKRLCKRCIAESQVDRPRDAFVNELARQFSCAPGRAVAHALDLIESIVVAEARVLAQSGQSPSVEVLKTKFLRKATAYSWLYTLILPIV